MSCLRSAGGALGLLVGYWSRQLLPFAQTAPLDWRVFGFVASLCLMTGIAFGLFPALRATRVDLSGSMKETSRNVTRSRTFLSKSLLVVQVAISLVVLIGAGLFLRTLHNLRNVEVGFNNTKSGDIQRESSIERVRRRKSRILIRSDPYESERSPRRSLRQPLADHITERQFQPDEHVHPGQAGERLHARRGAESLADDGLSGVHGGTLEIPLVQSRNLDVRVRYRKAQVSVINESAAKQFFPGEDPIGKRYGNSLEQNADVEIVGIVRRLPEYSRDRRPTNGIPAVSAASTTNAATFEVAAVRST